MHFYATLVVIASKAVCTVPMEIKLNSLELLKFENIFHAELSFSPCNARKNCEINFISCQFKNQKLKIFHFQVYFHWNCEDGLRVSVHIRLARISEYGEKYISPQKWKCMDQSICFSLQVCLIIKSDRLIWYFMIWMNIWVAYMRKWLLFALYVLYLIPQFHP